jgi:hypothetical protein
MATIIVGVASILLGGAGAGYVLNACMRLDRDVSDLNLERITREQVAIEMMSALPSDSGDTLAGVLRETACVEHYDICSIVEDVSRTARAARTADWWEERAVVPSFERDFERAPLVLQGGPGRILPKFAAACVMALRVKFGVRPPSAANVSMVEVEYFKLCKQRRVRTFDAIHHRQIVLSVFFGDTGESDFLAARWNAPRWLSWLISDYKLTGSTRVT